MKLFISLYLAVLIPLIEFKKFFSLSLFCAISTICEDGNIFFFFSINFRTSRGIFSVSMVKKSEEFMNSSRTILLEKLPIRKLSQNAFALNALLFEKTVVFILYFLAA